MKSVKFFMVAAMCLLSLVGCKQQVAKDSAVVDVTVTRDGKAVEAETVYMFTASVFNAHGLETKIFAQRSVATDANGVAHFELGWSDLAAVDEQTTLHFATYSDKDEVTGKTAVTVKKGAQTSAKIAL